MWRLAKPASHGGNSVRSVFTFVIAAFLAVLLAITVLSTPVAHAASATWKGSAIIYENNTYNGPVSATTVKDLGLFEGVRAYSYVEPASNIASPSSGSSSSSNSPPGSATRKIHVIYFGKDVDISAATKAQYRTYDYENKSTFTNPTNPVDIGIEAQSESSTGTSACNVEGGVGWWICPITNFLAWGTDQIFTLLSGFLTVQPPQTGQDNALYRAWSYMRSIANIAFVIAFLIIIYSQISNIGVDSYGIKKLLPRLIVAALLVNLSYYICAIAIDISNILGYSLQDIFIGIRDTLVGPEGNGYQTTSWQSVSGFILSGGTAATAGLIGGFVVLTDFGVVGSLFLLLPALVSALLALLVALFILAARQAIIIVFVIISPLAFVAYLLPNTEKWFEKWRDTFMTMLVLFPAFSLVFGGSQLAGTAIIQSADSINLVLLGMMVQVAPLFITPLLMRLGGDLLRQVGELANKPRQALQNRVNDYSKDRANNWKERRLRELDPNKFQPLRRGAHWREGRRRNREGLAEAAKNEADARWANDQRFRAIDQRSRRAGDVKSVGEHRSESQYNQSKLVTDLHTNALTRNQQLQIDLTEAKHLAEESENRLKLQYDELQAFDESNAEHQRLFGDTMKGIARTAVRHYQTSQSIQSQTQFAEGMQIQNYAKALTDSEAMRVEAGGIVDSQGVNRVLYSARATIDEAMTKAINEVVGNSGIHPGDVAGLRAALDDAVAKKDLAGMVAFTRLMAQSEDFGVKNLEEAIVDHELTLRQSDPELRANWKHYINYEADVNKYSESMGSWSRTDPNDDTLLADHRNRVSTWEDMRLEQFSEMKKSQQMRAFKVLIDSGKNEKALRMASELVNEEGDLRKNLKQSAIEVLEDYVANGRMDERRLNSMLSDGDGSNDNN